LFEIALNFGEEALQEMAMSEVLTNKWCSEAKNIRSAILLYKELKFDFRIGGIMLVDEANQHQR